MIGNSMVLDLPTDVQLEMFPWSGQPWDWFQMGRCQRSCFPTEEAYCTVFDKCFDFKVNARQSDKLSAPLFELKCTEVLLMCH